MQILTELLGLRREHITTGNGWLPFELLFLVFFFFWSVARRACEFPSLPVVPPHGSSGFRGRDEGEASQGLRTPKLKEALTLRFVQGLALRVFLSFTPPPPCPPHPRSDTGDSILRCLQSIIQQ